METNKRAPQRVKLWGALEKASGERIPEMPSALRFSSAHIEQETHVSEPEASKINLSESIS
jgi:hypothetical protein